MSEEFKSVEDMSIEELRSEQRAASDHGRLRS